MITNFALYNLSTGNFFKFLLSFFTQNAIIKRRIPIKKITSISISKISAEFVIHVPKEYDYRFSHPTLRDDIIYCIVKANLSRVYGPKKCLENKYLLFFHDEINLV